MLTASPSVFSNPSEYIILEVSCPGAESLLFTTLYRSPKAIRFNNFDVFSRYSFAYKNIIIGGNSNENLLLVLRLLLSVNLSPLMLSVLLTLI